MQRGRAGARLEVQQRGAGLGDPDIHAPRMQARPHVCRRHARQRECHDAAQRAPVVVQAAAGHVCARNRDQGLEIRDGPESLSWQI